jgi:hypothetical protein
MPALTFPAKLADTARLDMDDRSWGRHVRAKRDGDRQPARCPAAAIRDSSQGFDVFFGHPR